MNGVEELATRLSQLMTEAQEIILKLKGLPVEEVTVQNMVDIASRLVCDEYGIDRKLLMDMHRNPPLPEIRLMIWKVCKDKGLSNQTIAGQLNVRVATVRSYTSTYNFKYIEDEVFQNTLKKINQKLLQWKIKN